MEQTVKVNDKREKLKKHFEKHLAMKSSNFRSFNQRPTVTDDSKDRRQQKRK